MRVTFYCLKPIQVGDEYRQPGDLIPEAADWKTCRLMVQDADIAPVLVETLTKAQQVPYQAWEDEKAFLQLQQEEEAQIEEGVEA